MKKNLYCFGFCSVCGCLPIRMCRRFGGEAGVIDGKSVSLA